MSMFSITNRYYNVFLSDNERAVHWHVIPVHILSIETVVNKGFIHVVNDHIHEPNNLLNRNE